MVDVKDLMIGNWVYDGDRTQFPMFVETIGNDYVYLNFNGNEGDVWESTPAELQGIPLTNELMEKLQFSNSNGLWRKRCKGRWVSVKIETEFVFIEAFDEKLLDSRGWCHGIKYLHQLQNMFKVISKQELKIEL